jgi:hypothetical protein
MKEIERERTGAVISFVIQSLSESPLAHVSSFHCINILYL